MQRLVPVTTRSHNARSTRWSASSRRRRLERDDELLAEGPAEQRAQLLRVDAGGLHRVAQRGAFAYRNEQAVVARREAIHRDAVLEAGDRAVLGPKAEVHWLRVGVPLVRV